MRIPFLFSVLAALFFTSAVHADIDVRVGGGAGCNYTTIQAAINGALPVNGITNILIARDQAYNAQQLDIDGKNVRLLGGYANCQQTTRDSTKTVLNGAGGSARSILNIRGSTAVIGIYLLDFQNGDEQTDTSSYGGAIDITQGPHALIYLEENRFVNNRAGLGGAISIRNGTASQSGVYVRLASRNIVLQNTGIHGGGGIYCSGASLDIKGINNFIFQNTAGEAVEVPNYIGYGGGLSANDCRVNIGGQAVVFDGNSANGAGGGISAYGSRTVVHLYNINPDNPQILSNNLARTYGGGIDAEQGAKVYAWDMIIRNNIARTGGGAIALYDDGANDHSLFLASRYFTADTPNGDTSTFSKAFNCTQAEACNLIENNSAETETGDGLDGGAIRISTDGSGFSDAVLEGARLTLNHGDSIVWVKSFSSLASIANLTLNGTLVDSNQADGYFIRSTDGRTTLVNSSIGSNLIGAGSFSNGRVLCQPGFDQLRFESNAFWQPGKTIGSTSSGATAGCARFNVANDLSGLAAADQMLSLAANPLFVDSANGNLRLQASSPAIDFSPVQTNALTRDGQSRVEDDPAVANAYGPQDAGAYERTSGSDRIFRSGFDSN
jgi:predicted outer membrane repeat protein